MLNYQGEEGQWCILDASLKENELLLDKCSQYHMHMCERACIHTHKHLQKCQDHVSV